LEKEQVLVFFHAVRFQLVARTPTTPDHRDQARRTTSECFGSYCISRINAGVDVLWRDTLKKIRKPEPAWNRGPQDQLTILCGETDLAAGTQPNLFTQAAWNPHAKAISPLLNLRLHNPYSAYTQTIPLLVSAACASSL
jgi:hypothetical protein